MHWSHFVGRPCCLRPLELASDRSPQMDTEHLLQDIAHQADIAAPPTPQPVAGVTTKGGFSKSDGLVLCGKGKVVSSFLGLAQGCGRCFFVGVGSYFSMGAGSCFSEFPKDPMFLIEACGLLYIPHFYCHGHPDARAPEIA